MTDDGPAESGGDLAPADAFSLVGNEHRVAILRGLLAANQDPDREYPTAFSTLRELSGIEVSAQFSYHLDELVGAFLRHTDDGYAFRYAGWKVATALIAGTYTDRGGFDPTPVDGACPRCESTALEARYEDEWLSVSCTACERRLVRYPFPPGAAAERSVAGVLDAFDHRVRAHFALAGNGVCPECSGRTDGRLLADGHARFTCRLCGNVLTCGVGATLLSDPETLSTCRAWGCDPDARPLWELPFAVGTAAVTVAGDPPETATVRIDCGDRRLSVEVDESLSVIDRRQEST